MQPTEDAGEVVEAGNEDLFKLKAMKNQSDIDLVDQGMIYSHIFQSEILRSCLIVGDWLGDDDDTGFDPYKVVVDGDELVCFQPMALNSEIAIYGLARFFSICSHHTVHNLRRMTSRQKMKRTSRKMTRI